MISVVILVHVVRGILVLSFPSSSFPFALPFPFYILPLRHFFPLLSFCLAISLFIAFPFPFFRISSFDSLLFVFSFPSPSPFPLLLPSIRPFISFLFAFPLPSLLFVFLILHFHPSSSLFLFLPLRSFTFLISSQLPSLQEKLPLVCYWKNNFYILNNN